MNLQDFTCKCKKNSHLMQRELNKQIFSPLCLMLFPTCIFKACNYGNLLRNIDNYSVEGYKGLKFPWTTSLSKGHLISKGNFSVFKSVRSNLLKKQFLP